MESKLSKQQEQSMLIHFQNLCELSTEQLEAARSGKMEHLEDILAQKQMIIEQVNSLQEKIRIENCRTETKGQIRKLLSMIMGLEEESRQYMHKFKTAVQREMVSLRQENQLNEKYNAIIEAPRMFDESK